MDGVLVPGIEFPEGSRKVNRSSSPAALQEFWSGTLGHTMSSRLKMFEYTVRSECTALLNRSTEGSEGFGRGFSSCAAPNYLLSCAGVFQIVYRKFGSYPEWSVARRDERRVQIEARVYPEVWNQSSETQSGLNRQ